MLSVFDTPQLRATTLSTSLTRYYPELRMLENLDVFRNKAFWHIIADFIRGGRLMAHLQLCGYH